MPIVITNSVFANNKIGISMPSDVDFVGDNNSFVGNGASIEIREADRHPLTVVRNGDLEIQIPGSWSEVDIRELVAALQDGDNSAETATKTKIGTYLRQKIGDPTAFASELASIASFFFPMR